VIKKIKEYKHID